MDYNSLVPVFPYFFVFGGLPDSGKSTFLDAFFQNFSKDSVQSPSHTDDSLAGFAYRQIIAAGYDFRKPHGHINNLTFAKVTNKRQCHFALLSGFLNSSDKSDIRSLHEIKTNGIVTNEYFNSFLEFIRESYDASNPQAIDFPVDILKNGISLVNIWDTSINKALLSFFKCYNGCFENGYMCLFLDLERDVNKLHQPAEVNLEIEGSHDMMWKSRLHYLLHSCKIVKDEENSRSKVCTIFAKISDNKDKNSQDIDQLKRECEAAAKQIGVHNLIDFDIIPFNSSDKDAKAVLGHFKTLLQKQSLSRRIPLSWLLLRGALTHKKSVIITFAELKEVAKSSNLGLDASDLQKFCRFFSSFCSIICIKQKNTFSHIIINPIEFIKMLHNLFNPPASLANYIRYGILTEEMAYEVFNSVPAAERELCLTVLESVNFVVKLEGPIPALNRAMRNDDQSLRYYYIPSVRNTEPMKLLSKKTVHLYLDIMAPIVNIEVALIANLLHYLPNAELIPTEKMNVTSIGIRVQTLSLELKLTCLEDIFEFKIEIIETEKKKEVLMQVCSKILKACEKVVGDYSVKKKHTIKYNFGVLCENDDYTDVTYNIYHLRHNLPDNKLCEQCICKSILDNQVKSWNNALQKV